MWKMLTALLGFLPILLAQADTPRYKPSSVSPQALDITRNSYGYSSTAPNALAIGDIAPNFVLPGSGGQTIALKQLRAAGPVAIIFYRGHW